MALWKPASDQPVGSNEHVGRRLFSEPLLVGSTSQPSWKGLDLRHFEERRNREFSLDRLGKSGIDRRVVHIVLPLAVVQGSTFRPSKSFDGWVVIRSKFLVEGKVGGMTLQVFPSPVSGANANPYHAHVLLPEQEPIVNAWFMRHLFVTNGILHPISGDPATVMAIEPNPGLVRRVLRWLAKALGTKG